ARLADRNLFSGGPRQGAAAGWRLIQSREGADEIEILGPVGDVLEVDHALAPGRDHPVRGLGERGAHAGEESVVAGVAGRREAAESLRCAGRLGGNRRLAGRKLGGGAIVAGREGAQAWLDTDAGGADRGLEGL